MNNRFILAGLVFAAIVAVLLLSKPSITGFVPAEVFSQDLNVEVKESQRVVLKSAEPLSLSALSISGQVTGFGLVNVYLTDGYKRLLVYTNRHKTGSSMEQITGMAGLQLEAAEALYEVESLPDGYVTRTGVFRTECVETCVLDKELFAGRDVFLDVVLEPGTVLKISRVQFST